MAIHTLELCSGVGMLGEGLRAGLRYLGQETRTVCHVEREAYPAAVLATRMQEGSLDAAPVWSDLLTFNARAWAGAVDCVVAGFPCQDLSLAGRRAGLDGKRSGLFFNILDIAHDCGAQWLFLENVAAIASATATVMDDGQELQERAAARVLGELADRGWDAEWLTLSASAVGASHKRSRWFCFAWRGMEYLANQQHQRHSSSGRAAQRWTQHPSGCLANATSQENDHQSSGFFAQKPVDCVPSSELAHADNYSQRAQWRPEQRRRCSEGPHENTKPGDGGAIVANPQRGSDQRQKYSTHNKRYTQADRPPSRLGGCSNSTLFCPGPSDERWAEILSQHPEFAPAIEPGFCGMVDGVATPLDSNRTQRLRAVGNGVVALQAATAFVELFRRSQP